MDAAMTRVGALLLAAGALSGCVGQTGDQGTSGDLCPEVSVRRSTLEELEARGIDVAGPVRRELGDGKSWDMLLVAPVELWADARLSPPADRATRMTLSARPLKTATWLDYPENSPCRDEVRVELAVDVVLPDLGRALPVAPPAGMHEPSMALTSLMAGMDETDFDVEVLGSCRFRHSSEREADELSCPGLGGFESTWASSACLSASGLLAPPVDARSGLSLAGLIARASATLPIELTCAGGPPAVSLDSMEVVLPSAYCPSPREGAVPTVVDTGARELGIQGVFSGTVGLRPDVECLPRECTPARAGCPDDAGRPRCSRVDVLASLGHSTYLAVETQIADDGALLTWPAILSEPPDLSCDAIGVDVP